MDIFNPSLCLTKELKNSWSTNLVTESDPEKIPIEVAQGVPRLKMIHDTSSPDDWFACAIPLDNSWDPVDLSGFTLLKFTLYTDEEVGGLIRLEDEEGVESSDFEIETMAPAPGEEHALTLALEVFSQDGLNMQKIKLLKFIGYKGAAFYISEICLE